jgi:hypothetical protein
VYGPRIVADHIQISFGHGRDPFGSAPLRTRRDALALARDLKARLDRGIPFEQLAREIDERRDRTFVARRVNLYATNVNRMLFEHARELGDGEVGRPFETLSEVNILRRASFRPARPYEEVALLVRERMARERGRQWLEDRLADPSVVQVRWPLPERTVSDDAGED